MLLLLFLVPAVWALDCTTLTNCETCAGQSQGFLVCNWCTASSSCVIREDQCAHTDVIEIAYDCPKDPRSGFEYNETFARAHALPLSAAAYANDTVKCMITANTGVTITRVFEYVCDDANNTCKAFVGVHDVEKAVVLVARGSASVNQTLALIAETKNKDFVGGGKVHEYFYDAFDLLWNGGVQDELTRIKIQYPTYEFWVTGHSLGGSIASLFAEMAVVKDLWKGENIKLVTLGQPRTGDIVYAQNHDAKLPYSYRVIHAHDIVPHIPPKFGGDILFHHRYEVWYNNDMKIGDPYKICNRPDDDSCSNTEPDLSGPDHDLYFYKLSECCLNGCPPR